VVWRYCKFWVFFIFINVRDNKCRASILSGPKTKSSVYQELA
jgi:hypothetical protein